MLKPGAIAGGILALIVLAPAPAAAQDSRAPTTEEIIRKLTQPKLSPDDLKSNAVQIEGRRQRAESTPGPSIDLAVNFEYASARLTADARLILDNLGQALADPALRDSRFSIAGHTDARGGDAYNLALSKRRAQAVADYLVRQHGIGGQRLSVEGFGRNQLLDPANPASAVNRRVQITNLGS
jgi:outer membrane protein OmpA-like peptidoglycan-associated protein